MEKAEISRLVNSFNAIKSYFDTTKKYMPQIAKLVFFIEEILPLLETIHSNIHQSTSLIPSAAEKLGKVTDATEMAATEVMDIVDNVINRLNTMASALDEMENLKECKVDSDEVKERIKVIRDEIDGSQDDLFSIMNALQFQDITTQQINSIVSTIDTVNGKLRELLKGFEDHEVSVKLAKDAVFDPNAEFDFERSAQSQRLAEELLRGGVDDAGEEVPAERKPRAERPAPEMTEDEPVTAGSEDDIHGEIVFDEDGQPDISSVMNRLKKEKNEE